MTVYLNYQLIKIDFKDEIYRYSHIVLIKHNKQTLQLVSRSGKLGNKGKTTILAEVENTDTNLKEAMKKAKEHMRNKKKEGYVFQEDMENKMSTLYQNESRCDVCGDFMEKDLYHKINEWGRNEGGWDKRKTCSGYQKVLCIPCQMDKNLYKKRVK